MNQGSPLFRSFQGLQKVVRSKRELDRVFESILQELKSGEHSFLIEKSKKSIRFLDTFFSDTLTRETLELVISNAQEIGFKIKILMLNPVSHAASARARVIGQEPMIETSRALWSIYNSLCKALKKEIIAEREFNSKKMDGTFVNFLLKGIDIFGAKCGLELKFYDLPTEAPTYFFSYYVLKGLMVTAGSTVKAPWLLMVDDVTQSDDVYDVLSNNFDDIWKANSYGYTFFIDEFFKQSDKKKGVFIASNADLEWIDHLKQMVSELGWNPFSYGDFQQGAKHHHETIRKAQDASSRAIIILSKKSVEIDGRTKASENVIMEFAECRVRFGDNNVLLIVEDGISLPSNIEGVYRVDYTGVDDFSKIDLELKRFFNPK